MELQYVINLVVKGIFEGTLVITPLLIIVHLFKIRLFKIDKQVLIQSVNTCLLFGSVMFLISLFAEFFRAYYSQVEYEQYVFVNRYSGPFWYLGFVEIACKLLVPQILWFKRLRKSIYTLMVIFNLWVFLYIIRFAFVLFTPVWRMRTSPNAGAGINYQIGYPWQDLLVYTILLTAVYFILKRKSLTRAVLV
ncbi:hypothetical protein SAMN05428947_101724 [Mucilaginibacter sp. OK283]|nr:hypothetical protein SAMN05428947_101724 [Mucilaginibacter sp. OK283]